jgi:predicted nucleic acid-binding protein
MRALRRISTLVVPQKQLLATSDPDDNKVLECALEARADYVVTGNIQHFPRQFQDIRIIPPRRFLTLLASGPN